MCLCVYECDRLRDVKGIRKYYSKVGDFHSVFLYGSFVHKSIQHQKYL